MAGITPLRAVLFDAVGTLIRPEPAVPEAYLAVARQFGSRLSAQEIAARFPAAFARYDRAGEEGLSRPPTDQAAERRRWQAIVSAVLHDLPDAAGAPFEALWQHFAQPCHWRLYEDAAATWQALEQSGLVVGIASNFDDRLAGVCRGLPPLDRCQHIFWSARAGWLKPSPEFFAHIEQALGLAPQEILLVGDDYENDYLGATAAGWQAVLVERGNVQASETCRAIKSLEEFIEIVKS